MHRKDSNPGSLGRGISLKLRKSLQALVKFTFDTKGVIDKIYLKEQNVDSSELFKQLQLVKSKNLIKNIFHLK